MIDIPTNDSADLEAQQKARHQAELDRIAQQFMRGLEKSIQADVSCSEHMIGYNGSTAYHHLCDTIEVAKMFKAKGYHCYYYDMYNNHGVNQRGVCVRKTTMRESDIHHRTWSWHAI